MADKNLPVATAGPPVTIYTVGHSDHEPAALVALLLRHGVALVVDVRSSPYSRRVPQANREALLATLSGAGIAYSWLGRELGGRPDSVPPDYDRLAASAPFQQGIRRLLGLAGDRRCAVLCAEGDHRHCHRYVLITPALESAGAHVLHIQPDGTLVDDADGPRQLRLL